MIEVEDAVEEPITLSLSLKAGDNSSLSLVGDTSKQAILGKYEEAVVPAPEQDSCSYFDEKDKAWSTKGTVTSPLAGSANVGCKTKHLSDFITFKKPVMFDKEFEFARGYGLEGPKRLKNMLPMHCKCETGMNVRMLKTLEPNATYRQEFIFNPQMPNFDETEYEDRPQLWTVLNVTFDNETTPYGTRGPQGVMTAAGYGKVTEFLAIENASLTGNVGGSMWMNFEARGLPESVDYYQAVIWVKIHYIDHLVYRAHEVQYLPMVEDELNKIEVASGPPRPLSQDRKSTPLLRLGRFHAGEGIPLLIRLGGALGVGSCHFWPLHTSQLRGGSGQWPSLRGADGPARGRGQARKADQDSAHHLRH